MLTQIIATLFVAFLAFAVCGGLVLIILGIHERERAIEHAKLEIELEALRQSGERGPKLRSNSTLKSRGFDKSLKKNMDGTVEVRRGR